MAKAKIVSIEDSAWSLLSGVLSEDNTDKLIQIICEKLEGKLPFWVPMGLVARILDHLLPEVLLEALQEVHSGKGYDETRTVG